MVSFQCEGCSDVQTKKKLDSHYNRCRAPFTCLDCMTTFYGYDYKSHTSCVSEAQKYQGHLYREKDNKKDKSENKRQSSMGHNGGRAMVPRSAYVEDAPDGDDTNAVVIIDVPPPCPTPPPLAEPVGELPAAVNVFDFLVTDEAVHAAPKAISASKARRKIESGSQQVGRESQYSQYSQHSNGNGPQYLERGFSYGNAPLQPGFDRYDSYNNLMESQQSEPAYKTSYATPAPKEHRKEKREPRTVEKSDKKRKRNVEELDLSSAKRPGSRDATMLDAPKLSSSGRVLHSGLTGGLSRLVTNPEFYEDRIEAGPTPISPIKRNKRELDPKDAKEERRKSSYVSYGSSKAPSSKHADDKHSMSRSREQERHDDKHKTSRRRDSFSSDERSHASRRHHHKAIDYPDRPGSVQPTSKNQIVPYNSRAEHFMSFVTKGPDSSHGCSINKVLKRYHRERDIRSDEKEEENKDLWKSLRLRRNSRGEVVLFVEQ